MDTVLNAKVVDTFLGFEGDHGIFTAMLHFDVSEHTIRIGQSFGNHALDNSGGSKYIQKILKVFDVSRWEDLVGQYCRIKRGENTIRIVAIGHLVKNIWFEPKD